MTDSQISPDLFQDMDTSHPMNIHLTAICGTAMGALACMLKEAGHNITGSDANVYPPMSDFLREKDICLLQGFDQSHVLKNGIPDLVIIGNAVTRQNPEAQYVLENNLPHMSMPQAVNHFFARNKKIIMVTGTHGKTTTSSIMAHILSRAGLDPSFIIGGILKNYGSGFHIGKGEYLVIEGDEYDTAFFDKGPKFMHYDPHILISTGVEFDHADIFRDLDHIKQVFSNLVQKNMGNSHIIACKDCPNLMEILQKEKAPFTGYSKNKNTNSPWQISPIKMEKGSTRAKIQGTSVDYEITTNLAGEHNLSNLLACAAAAYQLGISPDVIQNAMTDFAGVKRRQEIRGIKNGITVMDDFAHHPTAVRETIAALKPVYQPGRLIAVFEPRTNTSMRSFFQKIYPASFAQADMVCVCKPCSKKVVPKRERFSIDQLVQDICHSGGDAHGFSTVDEMLNFLPENLQSGDLVLIMSNGEFDNIHNRLLAKL